MSELASLRARHDADQQPVTVSRGTVVHWDRIQQTLSVRQETLRKVRFELAVDLRVSLYMVPAPNVTEVLDAIDQAITEIESLKADFRKASGK